MQFPAQLISFPLLSVMLVSVLSFCCRICNSSSTSNFSVSRWQAPTWQQCLYTDAVTNMNGVSIFISFSNFRDLRESKEARECSERIISGENFFNSSMNSVLVSAK